MTNHSLSKDKRPYDLQFEHDACGVGFVLHIKRKRSHELDLRRACGCEENTGDDAGFVFPPENHATLSS